MNSIAARETMRPTMGGLLVIRDVRSDSVRLTSTGRRVFAAACAELGIAPSSVRTLKMLFEVHARETWQLE